jgi:hypothetical protein
VSQHTLTSTNSPEDSGRGIESQEGVQKLCSKWAHGPSADYSIGQHIQHGQIKSQEYRKYALLFGESDTHAKGRGGMEERIMCFHTTWIPPDHAQQAHTHAHYFARWFLDSNK